MQKKAANTPAQHCNVQLDKVQPREVHFSSSKDLVEGEWRMHCSQTGKGRYSVQSNRNTRPCFAGMAGEEKLFPFPQQQSPHKLKHTHTAQVSCGWLIRRVPPLFVGFEHIYIPASHCTFVELRPILTRATNITYVGLDSMRALWYPLPCSRTFFFFRIAKECTLTARDGRVCAFNIYSVEVNLKVDLFNFGIG